MSKEAIAHYEAALKEAFPRGATGEVFHHWNEARYLIATEALNRMAENARELGLDYEQPAQRPWAGLTEEEIETRAINFYNPEMYKRAVLWAQEKLKERNQ